MTNDKQFHNPGPQSASSQSSGAAPAQAQQEIVIGKSLVPAEVEGRATEVELFTMTLGNEAIYLLPLKTWSQLDVYKWRAQGKLPGTPPGLEIEIGWVKMGGESVSTTDPDACAKLERAFNEWLAMERQAVEHAKNEIQTQAAQTSELPPNSPQEEVLRFEVGLDKTGQPHIRCFEGKDLVADVACTVPGITSLLNDGLMRKPDTWKVGALRDWLELDGDIFRLKDGEEGRAALQRVLNERYHPAEGGANQDVKVFANPASTSGFDIQFAAADSGITENRRRHMDPDSIALLSDPHRCRVLRKGVILKFAPPTFHFKEQTHDGLEHDLEQRPENVVLIERENGQRKWIDLSQPFSHLDLDAQALTTIFNHASISRRVRRGNEREGAEGLDQAA